MSEPGSSAEWPEPFDGFDEFIDRTTASVRAGKAVTLLDRTYEAVLAAETELDSFAHQVAQRRGDLERLHAESHAPAFAAIDLAVGVFEAALRRLQIGGPLYGEVPHEVRYAVAAIGVRVFSTAHEINAMLRAGFPIGARARWRTLYELSLVANTLAEGNRWTCSRYVNHRWILIAKDLRDDPAMAESWQAQAPEIDRMRKRLLQRFGAEYDGKFGWAAELTKRRIGVSRPALHHLARLVAISGHKSRVLHAHHGVHADSLGILQHVTQDGLLHSGPGHRDIAATAKDTVHILFEIVDALVRTYNKTARLQGVEELRTLVDVIWLGLDESALAHAVRSGDVKVDDMLRLTSEKAPLEGRAFMEWFAGVIAEPDQTKPLDDNPTDEAFHYMLDKFREEGGVDVAHIEAWRELGYVVSELNQAYFEDEELEAWDEAVARHRFDQD